MQKYPSVMERNSLFHLEGVTRAEEKSNQFKQEHEECNMKVPAKIIFSLTLMNEKHCLFSEEGFKKPTYLTLSYL